MTAGIIAFLISNLLVSWLCSVIFTGENYKQKWGLSDDKIFKPLTNKRWKTFSIFFIGYCVMFFMLYYLNK